MAPTPVQDKTHLVQQLLNHTCQLCCYLRLVRVCLTKAYSLLLSPPCLTHILLASCYWKTPFWAAMTPQCWKTQSGKVINKLSFINPPTSSLLFSVGSDLIMAFHREFSSHSNPAQCLELAAALEKVCGERAVDLFSIYPPPSLSPLPPPVL